MKHVLIAAGILALVSGCGGSGAPAPAVPDPPPAAPAQPAEPFRLELVKVEAHTLRARFGGEPEPISSTWDITVKAVRQGTGDPPAAAGDMWLWYVFLTGDPDGAKVSELALKYPPTQIPRNGTMSVQRGGPTGRKLEFRTGRVKFRAKELEEAFGAGSHDRYGYAELTAPKLPEKWDGHLPHEITFLARNGYDNLPDILSKKAKPLEHNAVVAVRLCGFGTGSPDGADAVVLSRELRIPLEPGPEEKEKERPPGP